MGLQETMRALADPTRRRILNMLKQGPLPAGEISRQFDMSGAAISKHLSVLKEAKLVRVRQEGKFLYYELNASVLEEALLWLRNLRGAE